MKIARLRPDEFGHTLLQTKSAPTPEALSTDCKLTAHVVGELLGQVLPNLFGLLVFVL